MKPWLPLAMVIVATAASADDTGAAYGLGVHSCGEFAKLYAANPNITENTYFAWAEGFMSGLNASALADNFPHRRIEGGNASMQSYLLSIRTYCDAHPLSPYYGAVVNLYNSLPSVR